MKIKSRNLFLNGFYLNNMFKPFSFSKNSFISFDSRNDAKNYLEHIENEIISSEDIDSQEKEILLKTFYKFVIVE